MKKYAKVLPAFPMAAASLLMGAQPAWATDDNETPFSVAEVFFELNNTDGDLGIHALIDGEPWKKLKIEDPRERRMLLVRTNGRLRYQGLTELFFESAEPTFDELPPEQFFKRFPAGTYEIEGRTLDGRELESEAELTHVMPAPPVPKVNTASVVAIQCDAEEAGYDAPEVEVGSPVTIKWEEVKMSHPDADGGGAGVQPPVPVTIYNYEVVVEIEVDVNNEEFDSKFSVILPPGKTSMTIPDQFIAQGDVGDVFKYEVLAREESFNQTAVESCFQLVQLVD